MPRRNTHTTHEWVYADENIQNGSKNVLLAKRIDAPKYGTDGAIDVAEELSISFDDLLARCTDDACFVALFKMPASKDKRALLYWHGKDVEFEEKMGALYMYEMLIEHHRNRTRDFEGGNIDTDDVEVVKKVFHFG